MRVVLSPVELTGLPLEHKAQEAVKERADLPARIVRRLDFSLYGRDINVYRNNAALPRFRVVGNTRVYPSNDALLADIGNLPLETLASTVLLDAADAVDVTDVKPGAGEVALAEYRPDTFSLHTTTSSRQILVVASNYYPAWQCRIDGKPSRVSSSNGASSSPPASACASSTAYSPTCSDCSKAWPIGSASRSCSISWAARSGSCWTKARSPRPEAARGERGRAVAFGANIGSPELR